MTKEERYIQFVSDYKRLISGETEEISALANTSAAIHDEFHFFWVGFYIVKEGKLVLGPFQGSVACSYIQFGKGVCGTAWKEEKTQIVPDVEQFPGHIACSPLSRSEIVVPVFVNNEVKALLDIDSEHLNTFDDIDRQYLEQVTSILADTIYNKG